MTKAPASFEETSCLSKGSWYSFFLARSVCFGSCCAVSLAPGVCVRVCECDCCGGLEKEEATQNVQLIRLLIQAHNYLYASKIKSIYKTRKKKEKNN